MIMNTLFIFALFIRNIAAQDADTSCATFYGVANNLQDYLNIVFKRADTNTESLDNQGEAIDDYSSGDRAFAITDFDPMLVYYYADSDDLDSENPNLIDPNQDSTTRKIYLLLEKIVENSKSRIGSNQTPSSYLQNICQQTADYMLSTSRAVNCPSSGCTIDNFFDPITNYGCWCNLGSTITQGRGQPRDGFDTKCRDLQLCLRCARHDSIFSGYTCDPVTQTYTTVSSVTGGFAVDCATANSGDQCAIDVCMCEFQFIYELIQLLFIPDNTQSQWDENLVHDGTMATVGGTTHNGSFDPSTCAGPGGSTPHAIGCCGIKPERRPYDVSAKACCGDTHIYDSNTQFCCNNSGSYSVQYTTC